ncbi:DTW domain [Nesidiocoris tenuis]|uniref:tRNA-uridine aminocarboxypropyltransferase 1 n=1 Tax=Nesidiocoris tenuis TaxID=355587 RepID=A0ABN7AVN6_9HEMI|nr:DTW domain [Nesidiocoris tenuis]
MVSVDDENPFEGLAISEAWARLGSLSERTTCSKCGKSRKYFCYTCYIPVAEIADDVPKIELPLSVDIIKHVKEIDGKSTAVHAAVLSPNQVNVYTYPLIPSYSKEDKAVLVFPGPRARSLDELISECSENQEKTSPVHGFKKVVFIDSTWNQCKGIYKDPRLAELPCVVLRKRITQFWRHQKGSPRWYLSTIEAVHQFFVEFHMAQTSTDYDGRYDNLLFFFRYMYYKIHTLYDHDSLQSYKRPLI